MWGEKSKAENLIKKYQTNNPFKIAELMNIVVLFEDLKDTLGYFNKYKRIKMIHINQAATDIDQRFICAHELGHSVLHPSVNTPFLKKNTLFSISKIEQEANAFAVELLLPDRLLRENAECSVFNIGKAVGIPDKLIKLKVK